MHTAVNKEIRANVRKLVDLLEDDDYNLWGMVQITRQVMSSAREKELAPFGISSVEAIVLFVIQIIRASGLKSTPAEISRWLYQKPHSISELLNRMEKKGLVKKVPGEDRKNSKNVMITAEGKRTYERSSQRLAVRRILSCLTEEERGHLWHCLGKLREEGARELGSKVMAWPRPAIASP
ncbi:MAG: winged helix-turn-helix transcriptional regulator [Chloroflexi bacterium]|nr:winged helix-turn-helix transcriptional regulator [Chloroflexota bacterium]